VKNSLSQNFVGRDTFKNITNSCMNAELADILLIALSILSTINTMKEEIESFILFLI